MSILCLTHSGDFFTIDRVIDALAELGHEGIRINTDLFPTEIFLVTDPLAGTFQMQLADGRTIHSPDIQAVWLRKMFHPKYGHDLDPAFRDSCRKEASACFVGTLAALAKVPWLDPLNLQVAAENKLLQLNLARKHGLTVVPTLVTNQPSAVRQFFQEQNQDVVTKMLTAFATSMAGGDAVYTNPLEQEHLDQLEGLKYAPMIFQKNVDKALELRVVYVDGQCFCGGIDTQSTETGQSDWRRTQEQHPHWQQAHLPKEIITGCRLLMEELGLLYGAFDFILTPDGDYVFLEVNPAGEWGMLEKELGLPISKAIASALVRRISP